MSRHVLPDRRKSLLQVRLYIVEHACAEAYAGHTKCAQGGDSWRLGSLKMFTCTPMRRVNVEMSR